MHHVLAEEVPGVLLGMGLIATIGVTWYVMRLARHQLADSRPQRGLAAPSAEPGRARPTSNGWPWGATTVAALALLLSGLASYSCSQPGKLRQALPFGPPLAQISESYAAGEASSGTRTAAP